MREREPKEGRHHAHAEKTGNRRRKAQRRKRKPTTFVLLLADADFEAWFANAKRQLGMA